MPSPTSPTPARPPWYRGLLLGVGLAILGPVLVQLLFGNFNPVATVLSLVISVVYALCLGGVFTLATPFLDRRLAAMRFPLDWLIFLPVFTVLTGLGAAVASFILYAVGVVPGRIDWNALQFINRLVFVLALIFGIFSFLYTKTRRRLGARNLELQRSLESTSRQVQAQERELERAREIQEALLPKELPRVEGFSLFGAWAPAKTVGGDYYDASPLSDQAIGLCIADVVGKGIGAALLMSNLQAAVQAFASPRMSPAELCRRVNQVITSHVADGKFITFFYGILEPANRRLVYSCAGHNPPILVRREGRVVRLNEGGPVLGVFPHQRYEQGRIDASRGDRLVLFTDGVTEAADSCDEEFGDERLVSLVVENRHLEAQRLAREVLDAVGRFSEGQFQDDATLLVVSAD